MTRPPLKKRQIGQGPVPQAIDRELYGAIREFAIENGVTVKSVVEAAVVEYLAERAPGARAVPAEGAEMRHG